jgi:hypothetical protein
LPIDINFPATGSILLINLRFWRTGQASLMLKSRLLIVLHIAKPPVFAYDLNHVPCMCFSIIFAAALKLLHKKTRNEF